MLEHLNYQHNYIHMIITVKITTSSIAYRGSYLYSTDFSVNSNCKDYA